tara:strand:+ start:34399 stop:35475 length:1077 start_codon:yes stop_codon:yes gene_type:complete
MQALEVKEALLAGNEVAALEEALSLWRATRSQTIANVVEWLDEKCADVMPKDKSTQEVWLSLSQSPTTTTVGWLAKNLVRGAKVTADYRGLLNETYSQAKYAALVARLDCLADFAPDPRIASALVGILEDGKLTAWGTERVIYERCCKLLVAIGDRRASARLQSLVDSPRAKTQGVRNCLVEILPRFVKVINASREESPGRLSDWAALLPQETVSAADQERADALLDLILESPDELDLRHVYSDALQEIGDPRGEFIALQLSGVSTAAAKKRMRQLIREHSASWLGPDLSRVFASVVYKNGFLDIVTLGGNAVAPAEDWKRAYTDKRLATVTKVHKGKCNRRHLAAFLASKAMKSLAT